MGLLQAGLLGAAVTRQWLLGTLRQRSRPLPDARQHVPAVRPGLYRHRTVPAIPDSSQHLCR